MMWSFPDFTHIDRENVKKLTLSFRFLGRHTGAGRFFRQQDGLFVLEISDRWGAYICPMRYQLDQIDTVEKADAICTAAAERECGRDVDSSGKQPKRLQ